MGPKKKAVNVAPQRLESHGVSWAALLLFVMVGFAYSNSLDAIWTLDDDPNILQNFHLHIKDLQPETLFKTFFSPLHPDENGRPGLNRPLAHLSFALNWYFGKSSPAGYRLVNIFIHFLAAFVLFLVLRDLLETPNMRGQSHDCMGSVPLIGAVLWALNPIQTQAVVYIVQRMASLACLFYLIAIWCYIRGRASGARRRRAAFYVLTMVSFLAGVGSKENAILLPAALLLLEFTFFQDWSQPAVRRRFSYVLSSALCMLLSVGWLFSSGKLDSLLDYSIRLFNPWERLLTQSRVIFFYLSQIFYPVPDQLSIAHDVELSRSLIEPWTTLPAILGVLVLIWFGVWQMHKRPMLSFAILFFFLNHAIESSVIGLELIYEHRNYLPSLFLFAPVAIGLRRLIDHYRAQSSIINRVVRISIILLITSFGTGTYIRNLAWLDPKTFWEDAAYKAPFSIRPLHNLAYSYYEKQGEYQKAFELYQKAIKLKGYNRQELSSTHVNLANYHFRRGDFSQAMVHLDQAHEAFPGFELVRRLKIFVLYRSGSYEAALDILKPLLANRPNSVDYQILMAEILLLVGRSEDAMKHIQHAIHIAPDSERTLFMMGMALNLKGDYGQARVVLGRLLKLFPNNKEGLLWMVDSILQTADPLSAAVYAQSFLKGFPSDRIEGAILMTLSSSFMPEPTKLRLIQWFIDPISFIGTSETGGGADKSNSTALEHGTDS